VVFSEVESQLFGVVGERSAREKGNCEEGQGRILRSTSIQKRGGSDRLQRDREKSFHLEKGDWGGGSHVGLKGGSKCKETPKKAGSLVRSRGLSRDLKRRHAQKGNMERGGGGGYATPVGILL